MLPEQTSFFFYIETLMKDGKIDYDGLNLVNNLGNEICYYFTHNCDMSRRTYYNKLLNSNISCRYRNVMTPNYLLITYCQKIYGNFSVYPISISKDLFDFKDLDISITSNNPDLIFINTKTIDEKEMEMIENTKCALVFSSNLCKYRLSNCVNCTDNCIIKHIKSKFKDRLIIPDMPGIYNSYNLFKNLNIIPKRVTLISHKLRDDYFQYKRCGCKFILVLNNGTSYYKYIKSPYDPNLVVDNFKTLSVFLKK